MNEEDPISQWENAIKSRLFDASILVILLAYVFLLIAPVFGPIIKQFKRRKYVFHKNYEELAEEDMQKIRPWLWAGAILGWIFFFYCQAHYP